MSHAHSCPKCGVPMLRIPDRPGRYASGNNIYTTSVTLLGNIPVIRHVCPDCGFVEHWVEEPDQRAALRRVFGGE